MASNLSFSRDQNECAAAIAALVIDHVASYQGSEDSLLSVASAITEGPLCYLRSRDRSLELLGIGCVASFRSESLEQFRATFDWVVPALRNHPQRDALYLLGGTSFDGEIPGGEWHGFDGIHFLIPRCLFRRHRNQVDVFLASDHAGPITGSPRADHRDYSVSWERTEPAPAAWDQVVTQALNHIANGSFEKVVLARQSNAELNAPVHPARLLERLLSSPQRVTGFAFAPGSSVNRCFFGATPELLFTLNESTLVSEAVAGTLRRDAIEREGFPRDLSAMRATQKDHTEHECVVSAIVERLRTVSEQVEAAREPSLTPLHDLYHLVTPIRAQLAKALSPIDLIALLHPSPAVCGSPRESAREFIRTYESFERGWYAGTIGYINDCRAEFSVGLRSALLDGQNSPPTSVRA